MPALAASALFLAAGCSSEPAASPAPGHSRGADTSGPAAAGSDRPAAAVVAAPEPAATSTAVARAGVAGGKARKTSMKVRSYDSHTRRAVISTPDKGGSDGKVTSSPSPTGGSPERPHRTAVGDVIASAPVPGAPDGLLAKVTGVIAERGDGTEVQTAPTTLDALLGDGDAKGSVPVDPASFDVDRLLPDVKVSWAKTGNVHAGPEGAKVPLGSLRIDVGARLGTAAGAPAGASASVSGFVQVAPEVDFSYGGGTAGSGPGAAYLGVSGDWTSKWALKGRAAASADPVRVPFAKLHADPVLQVGPIPVVVNLDLTCYFQIAADGSVTVDVEQDLKGDFKAGGTFGTAKGWTPVDESHMTSSPVRTSVTAAGRVKASLGAEATVGLYGTVGVTADLAPYLRAEAAGALGTDSAVASGGSAGSAGKAGAGAKAGAGSGGSWSVHGGVDLTGTLRVQLSVFGTPVLQRSLPLGSLHREWTLAEGRA
ncbi:hypothetical protein BKI49_32155 [Streptomyces sp. Tue6028]|uniref:hypothetical protein n=1 Tax=Streptomyces sp. Tue6028 TaxID=2036037 RepID=UPI000BB2F7FC|nr:hypothetical protein [Streptomyces sp. Tue6028]PBC60052.1 hypothetical protein BKI49_32155 [Streptomyces sp. Tue6028]